MKIDFPPLIAAVWDSKTDFERIRRYKGDTVFILKTDLISVQGQIKAYKKMSFRVFVDIDFVDGLSGDEYGFRFLKLQGLDGII
ncbi:MAG TPA: glycerol-3-phosphate responsive antiterminator, partial [Thermotogota bacterium]|nr:glycerol-3-phosphate responsive antiterminator [Thermotogota bacterium]